jgi:hypothetical protein
MVSSCIRSEKHEKQIVHPDVLGDCCFGRLLPPGTYWRISLRSWTLPLPCIPMRNITQFFSDVLLLFEVKVPNLGIWLGGCAQNWKHVDTRLI